MCFWGRGGGGGWCVCVCIACTDEIRINSRLELTQTLRGTHAFLQLANADVHLPDEVIEDQHLFAGQRTRALPMVLFHCSSWKSV